MCFVGCPFEVAAKCVCCGELQTMYVTWNMVLVRGLFLVNTYIRAKLPGRQPVLLELNVNATLYAILVPIK